MSPGSTPRALRRWPIVIGAVVVVLVVGAGATWAMTRSSGSSSAATRLVAAKRTTINQTVSTSGTIAAAHEADLDFASSGRVRAVRVAVGDRVRSGETLATIGAAALRADRDAARASLASAESAVADSSAGAARTAAESELIAARSALRTARRALAGAHLRASIAGTVTSVDLTRGESVSGDSGAASTTGISSTSTSTSTSQTSSSQVVIQSTRTFVVDTTVDDTEVTSVKKGQPVAVTPDGASASVKGVVTSVSSVPSASSTVVSFPVVVRLAGHPSGVYAGASATAVITTKHTANVLEIPTFAITYQGSKATVRVRSGGSTTTRAITVGTGYGLETQVVAGLRAGEVVVVTTPTVDGRPSGSGGSTGESGTGSGGFPGGSGSSGSSGEGGFPSGAGPGGFSGGAG